MADEGEITLEIGEEALATSGTNDDQLRRQAEDEWAQVEALQKGDCVIDRSNKSFLIFIFAAREKKEKEQPKEKYGKKKSSILIHYDDAHAHFASLDLSEQKVQSLPFHLYVSEIPLIEINRHVR